MSEARTQLDFSAVRELMQHCACSEDGNPARLLKEKKKVFCGAELLVGLKDKVVFHEAFGLRSVLPDITPLAKDTVYDIASLTKPLVTTTLLMKLAESGRLTPERRLSTILQGFGTKGREAITLRHLLTHSAGFPAWKPFYKDVLKQDVKERQGLLGRSDAVPLILKSIFETPLLSVPGEKSVYSDLGFILLGEAVQTLFGSNSLEKLARQHIFGPLGMEDTGYIPLETIWQHRPDLARIAPTINCPWRAKLIHAEVQDDNAWAMGGVAGHAGVFSTAKDLHKFSAELLSSYLGKGSFVAPDIVQLFWEKDSRISGTTWALGWDTPTPGASSAGRYFSHASVGHLGYSGCSLWIDPKSGVQVILLSNRVHPGDRNDEIRAFRPKLHDAVMEALKLDGSG
jgi:CubicO group peptidase (beta-lactamase class C family)